MTRCEFVPLASYDFSMWRQGPWEWNPTVYSFISAVSAVAIFMSVDLSLYSIFRTKRKESRYFWAINITAWGVAFQTIAFILLIFVPACPPVFSVLLAKIGWISNVTGFAFVLYLRLHLVVRDRRLLRFILAWIIVDGVVFHLTTAAFEFGMVTSEDPASWIAHLSVVERISVIMFSLQEAFISAIYIWTTTRFVRNTYGRDTRGMLVLMLSAQAVVFLSDIVMIVLDYADYFYIKAIIHPFIYGLKLKVEFVFLNQLVTLVKSGIGSHTASNRYTSGDRRGLHYTASARKAPAACPAADREWELENISPGRPSAPPPTHSGITQVVEVDVSWQDRYGENVGAEKAPNDGEVASQTSLVTHNRPVCREASGSMDGLEK